MALPAALQHLSLPVIAAPMFIASGPALVIEQCKAGIVGSFPALNARPAAQLDVWLTDIEQALADHKMTHPDAIIGPIAVNQIVHQSNDRLAQDVEAAATDYERLQSLLAEMAALTQEKDALEVEWLESAEVIADTP